MLLRPVKKETKEEFLTRAMDDSEMVAAHPDKEARAGVCESMWANYQNIDEGVERRVLVVEDIGLRIDGVDSPKITGYAAKFGKWSEDLGGFREKIRVGAFDDVLDDDVRALKNHDPNLLLGRTKSGTLRLTANKTGLRFEIDPPDTNVGRDTVEEIRRGDISGCSFGFIIETDEWRYLQDDTVERTIIKFRKLFDVGPVTYPAYPDTSVAARSLNKLKEQRQAEQSVDDQQEQTVESDAPTEDEVREKEKEDRNRKREINNKYLKAGRIINRNKPA